ncbi:1,2-phenylacetyl-CoA epoxidase subunit PaaC [Ornithinicoccus halotolerans]|uniref:1,2-phenylacetyl-CoA epoxidase subunit PaaC n=1 Tax=Ornithinicoccus halotolerans TaxID=1748220 RepID=UPI001294C817|nr:1,2-phenylacetyl-CoA epoxidase subunit PaaC [Ornithinicoccus halotolerans]
MTEAGSGAATAAGASRHAGRVDPLVVLGLADDALVYAQRLGEWLTRAPEIEEDMALGNIGLDLLGQARGLLTRVGELDGTGRDEDALAFWRDEREFRNVQLVERPRGDFAHEMARLLWFSAHRLERLRQEQQSPDEVVAGVAGKAVKEVAYHRDHATQWVLRLGDGTEESRARMQQALVDVAPYLPELTEDDPVGAPVAREYVEAVLAEAGLGAPPEPRWHARGGRTGIHSEAMGFLLAEMQHLHRTHPGASW